MAERTITVERLHELVKAALAEAVQKEQISKENTPESRIAGYWEGKTVALREVASRLTALTASTQPGVERGGLEGLKGDIEIQVRELLDRAGLESSPEMLWDRRSEIVEEAAWLKGRDDTLEHVRADLAIYIAYAFEEFKFAPTQPLLDLEAKESFVGDDGEVYSDLTQRERALLSSAVESKRQLKRLIAEQEEAHEALGDLDALKERLTSDEVVEAVAEALHDADFTVVLDEKLKKLPTYGGEITWPELAQVALRAARAAALPDTEQGDA